MSDVHGFKLLDGCPVSAVRPVEAARRRSEQCPVSFESREHGLFSCGRVVGHSGRCVAFGMGGGALASWWASAHSAASEYPARRLVAELSARAVCLKSYLRRRERDFAGRLLLSGILSDLERLSRIVGGDVGGATNVTPVSGPHAVRAGLGWRRWFGSSAGGES